MQISVLGELTVSRDGHIALISAPKQRMLLALLIANLGRSVSLDRILETLYGDRLPGNPASALRFHVSKLRKALEPDAPATHRTGVIRTTPHGYQLDVDPSAIDAHRFASLANQAASLVAHDPANAASVAAEALELWVGDPLTEFEYEDFAQPLRIELIERKLGLDESHIEAMLAVGDTDGAIAHLRPLIGQHPYREGLYSLLMTALYRAGRQVDALAVYREARELLLEDLGIDPGPELAQLEHQILTQAPDLLPTAAPGIRHNLPPAVSLVGRRDAHTALQELMRDHRFVQVTGLAGVGKSVLAVAAAHSSLDAFSDGVLYIAIDEAMTSREIIERLGAGISMIGSRTVDDGNALRTIGGMDLLVVIDDGHHSEHAVREIVGRILADGDQAAVLLTARAPIRDVPGSDHTLEPLEPATDGLDLLRSLVGGDRQSGADLVQLAIATGGIPSVIEIAAAAVRAAAAGGVSMGEAERAILDTTKADLANEVSTGLPDGALHLARRLALFSEGLGLERMIELLDPTVSPVTVLDDLSVLVAAGVARADQGRYNITSVLASSFDESLSDGERLSVLERAAEHFTRTIGTHLPANADVVAHRLIAAGAPETTLHLLAGLGSVWWQQPARARFANLCGAAIEASTNPAGRDLEAVLFYATHAFLDLGEETSALRYAARYADVAADLKEPSVEMHAHQLRGNVLAYTGVFVDVEVEYSVALEIGRRIGHLEATWIAASRAAANILLGDTDAAEAGADEVDALATIRRQTRGRGLAAELRGSGAFLRGDITEAVVGFSQAREIATSCGAVREEIIALRRLAESHIALGDLEAAAHYVEGASALSGAAGLADPPLLMAVSAMVAAEHGDEPQADRLLANLQGSLRYRRPASWIHGALVASTIVNVSAGRDAEAVLCMAALDDVGRRTGIVLPSPWESRIGEIRAGSVGELDSEDAMQARLMDPVDLIF